MYIPRTILILVLVIYILFLVSVDWINQPSGAWYRPYLVGLAIVIVAAWAHRGSDSDEL